MTRHEVTGTVLSLLVALFGAVFFWIIGFPAAALTGSAAAVSLAGLSGLPIVMPRAMQTLAFMLLGMNIGSSVTPEMLKGAISWPISIGVLALSLVISMVVSKQGLMRWLGYDARTAVLASAPGHLSYVLSLSMDSKADTSTVAIVQSIRVLFLTLCVPVIVAQIFGATGVDLAPTGVLNPLHGVLLLAATFGVGLVFKRLRVPAAFLLAGMCVSAIGHGAGLTPGRMPGPVVYVAFLVMGVLIGSRFGGKTVEELRGCVAAGAWITGVNVVMALLAVAVCMWLLGASPALLIVAFSPGGVEAMAAIAVSLGLDPAFVAAHHVMRLVLLTFLVPAILASAAKQE